MKLLVTLLAVFLLNGNALGQSEAPMLNVTFDDVLALPTSEPDAVLEYGSDQFQFGKLWVPEQSQHPAPLVIMIHGGCWLNSFDVHHTDALNHGLVNEGFAVWAIEYRRTGDDGGGWPGTYDDVLAAIAHAAEFGTYGVDPARKAIIGHSAGGHLALLAGTEFSEAELIISLAGIADITSYAAGNSSCEQAAVQFIGASPAEDPAAFIAANPVNKSLHPNTLLMHGEMDEIVPLDQIESISAAKIVVPGAGHFDWIHTQTSAYTQLVERLEQALKP